MASTAEAEHDWLSLATAPGLGPVGARRLAAAVGGVGALLRTPLAAIRELGGSAVADALEAIDRDAVAASLRWRDAGPDRHLLCLDDPRYPERLKALPDAPLVLFLRGAPGALQGSHLAMVGSRHPTRTGEDNASAFARDLAASGLGIVSGLARGIDAAAHRGAIAAQGVTLAVLGHGPDRVYPREHVDLARAILETGGAVLGEFPPGVPPAAANFPRRNRVISGLSLGVLVVEAAVRSGSLITARTALEQGREVFAVPGSIHNPMARGCHRLIRDGAKLVETTSDVLEELGLPAIGTPGPAPAPTVQELDDEYVTVLDAMGHDPLSVDLLVQRTGLTPQVLSSMLLSLEMKGLVSPIRGGLYVRRQEGTE